VDKTFKEYQKEIAELQKKAIEARRQETAGAIAQIKALMKEFDLSIADLGTRPAKESKGIASPLPAKFRDPASGATWTGRGRAPAWAAEAKAAGKLASLTIEKAKAGSGKKTAKAPVAAEKKAAAKKTTAKAPAKRTAKPKATQPAPAAETAATSQ
jgi:DNA-binding protein H-NS